MTCKRSQPTARAYPSTKTRSKPTSRIATRLRIGEGSRGVEEETEALNMSEYLGKPNEYYMLRRAARRLAERFVSCHDFRIVQAKSPICMPL